jgi:hypothetical protein
MLNLCGIVAAILKMATGRNLSVSAINSGHHYLPRYQILMISDIVEFLWYCRGSKGVGVTIDTYEKVEISYINVDNF